MKHLNVFFSTHDVGACFLYERRGVPFFYICGSRLAAKRQDINCNKKQTIYNVCLISTNQAVRQIVNVGANFFYESLQNILSQEVSLVQLSQKLERLVNQTGGEVLKAILKQADAAIYAAIKPEHRYQVKVHRSRTLTNDFLVVQRN